MSKVSTQFNSENKDYTISILGTFDFHLTGPFSEAYRDINEPFEKLVIDMGKTTMIDSAGLGLLLSMQGYLEKKDGEINIINCNPGVAKTFEISHFSVKFSFH